MSKKYDVRDKYGSTYELEADSMAEAISLAEDWCRGGDWDEEGEVVRIWVSEQGSDEEEGLSVEIEPDHEALIAAAVGDDNPCGSDPDDHDWTSEGEGGCTENPGVWSTGGTAITTASHCRRCGLRRTYTEIGPQRNPGESNTVQYEMPDDERIEAMREARQDSD